jgi:hypothetical protein
VGGGGAFGGHGRRTEVSASYTAPMRRAPWLLVLLLACRPAAWPADDDDDVIEQSDADADGVPDGRDACPTDPLQWSDADGDGVCDEVDDACPDDAAGWEDVDGDGWCPPTDACELDPLGWTDADGDGRCDESADACPGDPQGWTDFDGDGHCDENDDACPGDPLQWTDADGDGVCDEVDDDCPDNPDAFSDSNGDGVCDGNDDFDGDGIADAEEIVYGLDCAISDPMSADTDGDGVIDPLDLYPRDPFPAYLLYGNDVGTIDMMLTNGDGTFAPAIATGIPFGDTANSAYRYGGFVIADFDGNGTTDFLALGDADPSDPDNARELWWMSRITGPTSLSQRLVDPALPHPFFSMVADLDNDDLIDLMRVVRTPVPTGNLTSLVIESYLNAGTIGTATCAFTEDPLNPGGCAFIRAQAIDLSAWASGQWVARFSRDAVDVDGDGNRDLVAVTHSNGGNGANKVSLLRGQGDGTFVLQAGELFQFNTAGSPGGSPINSIAFGDFDGDGLGDFVGGMDDDGDAGSGWFVPGMLGPNGFDFDTAAAFEAFDVNPAAEIGGEAMGVSFNLRPFDWDFDGQLDLLMGYRHTSAWTGPSRAVYLRGLGNGDFDAPVTVQEDAGSGRAQSFAAPYRLCQRFPLGN